MNKEAIEWLLVQYPDKPLAKLLDLSLFQDPRGRPPFPSIF
jgi:hypothetical protein